jgi:hypothetical protein
MEKKLLFFWMESKEVLRLIVLGSFCKGNWNLDTGKYQIHYFCHAFFGLRKRMPG